MNSRSLSDPLLTDLLSDLLAEEQLPAVDRWFSHRAKALGWPAARQKHYWDALRRALARGYSLLSDGSTAEVCGWGGFRIALRGRAGEWAIRADHPGHEISDPLMAGIPGWLRPALEDRIVRSNWGAAEVGVFLESQETPAPVHVRFRDGIDGVCALRFRAAKQVEESDVQGLFQLSGDRGLEGGSEWSQGLVEIQDASSQLSLVRLGLRPGQRVWDVCAGQGGKTLLAAQELRGKGTLVASEVSAAKRKALKDRVRRSGWQNIRLLEWDGNELPDFGPEMRNRGGFDRVIVDAPCSASGTWRRDPEGRFRLSPMGLRELHRHQARLLRLGWDALKPGGSLSYITCSWIPSENEEIVQVFCAESGAEVLFEELLGLPLFDANTLYVATLEKRK